MTNNTIPNVPFELLAELQEHIDCHRDAVLWGKVCDMLSAPSPAGVEGLEVVGVRVTSDGFGSYIADSAMGMPATFPGEVREPLCRLSSASSIIIGLQEKIERLQFSLEVAKTDELSAAVYAETESIKHSLRDTEKERDQLAQRLGDMEQILRDLMPGCKGPLMRQRIEAALAGKAAQA